MTGIRGLRQKYLLYILAPTAILLVIMGAAGFLFARDRLLDQWTEATVLKLRWAAHRVDMRMERITRQVKIFGDSAKEPEAIAIQKFILEGLKKTDGVADVRLIWNQPPASSGEEAPTVVPGREQGIPGRMSGMGLRRFRSARIARLASPEFDAVTGKQQVELNVVLLDEDSRDIGKLSVILNFGYLIEDVVTEIWWQANQAFIMDETGRIIVCANPAPEAEPCESDTLKGRVLEAAGKTPYGAVYGPGRPPSEVAGYHVLTEAPWILVMDAPGDRVMAPIMSFRNAYFAMVGAFIVVVVILIWWVTGRTVHSVRNVARAATDVAGGRFDRLPGTSAQDEIGDLFRSFNRMVGQLEDRLRMKKAMELAMEVQQSLLPQQPPSIPGLDIAGKSLYCDETGGDYYDYIFFQEHGRLVVLVGDVSDHGLQAALLMTTARAQLRQRAALPGAPEEIIRDVNLQLSRDVGDSGRFMTLFHLEIGLAEKRLRWVNAGHEPAMVYDPETDEFEELAGRGLALGVDEDYPFVQNQREFRSGQIILLGTDGLWEIQNTQGEMFGKENLRRVIREFHRQLAQGILEGILNRIGEFCPLHESRDDVTLVVVKVG